MSSPSANHAGPRYAVLANRATGELCTVPTDDALVKVASGAWMLIVRETEHTPPSSDEERDKRAGVRQLWLNVQCLQSHANGCPVSDWVSVVAAEDWDARDLEIIEEAVAEILNTDCLLWSIRLTDRDKKRQRTEIAIEPGRTVGKYEDERFRGHHQVSLQVDGHLNANTLAWLMRQSRRMHLCLITDALAEETSETGNWAEPAGDVAKLPKAKRVVAGDQK